jgi:hypothetical protein
VVRLTHFHSVFAVLLIAFHELVVREGKIVTDYGAVKKCLQGLSKRIDTSRKATSVDERRRNIDSIKGLIAACFVDAKPPAIIYGGHMSMDIEAVIRRSEIEVGNYELKQGMLSLYDGTVDIGLIEKVVKTICAIANNGPQGRGTIIIGVTDKDADAERVRELDQIEPRKVGKRWVVGVSREARRIKLSTEQYYAKWKDGIRNSRLSPTLRDGVLSNMDFNSFYGLGVVIIVVPPQKEFSYVGDEVFWRDGDATSLASNAKQIASLAKRF